VTGGQGGGGRVTGGREGDRGTVEQSNSGTGGRGNRGDRVMQKGEGGRRVKVGKAMGAECGRQLGVQGL